MLHSVGIRRRVKLEQLARTRSNEVISLDFDTVTPDSSKGRRAALVSTISLRLDLAESVFYFGVTVHGLWP